MFRTILTLATFLSGTAQANAQWVHQAKEDASSGETVQIAIGVDTPYALALRCTSVDDLMMIYMTPEAVEPGSLEPLQAAKPTLKLRIDDEPVVEIPTTLTTTGNAGETRVAAESEGDAVVTLAREIAKATRRVAVVIDVIGQKLHQHEIGVSGSGKAIDAALNGCGFPD